MSVHGAGIPDHLARVAATLTRWEPLWREVPFREPVLAWEGDHPELAGWLRGLDDADVLAAEADPASLDGPAAWRALVAETEAADLRQPVRGADRAVMPTVRGVKVRKRAQIAHLGAVVAEGMGPEDHLVEWCAGRGHLARTVARTAGCTAQLLERDPALCRAPDHHELRGVTHLCVDVRDADQLHGLPDGVHWAGLHACGDLSDLLVAAARARGAVRIVVAPCCHWKVSTDAWQPRSRLGRSAPTLDRQALRLAVAGEEVASARRRHLRRVEVAWRLALDGLISERTGARPPTSFSSVPRTWFEGPFHTFRDRVAASTGVPVGGKADDVAVELQGWARARVARRFALVRGRFQRVIEVFLLLDRAVALQEAGYDVEVGTFCAPTITPRNLVLVATR